MSTLKPIHVLDKRVALYQIEGAFRSSIDAVLLAAACPVKKDQRVLDLGCGIGTAGLCVLARVPDIFLTGVDIQDTHIAMAEENARMNGFQDRVRFISHDVQDFKDIQDGKNILYDHLICNPPYNDTGQYTKAATPEKSAAMSHSEGMGLRDWVDSANRNIKARGSLSMIHKAEKLDDLLHSLDRRFGAVEVIPFWPKAGQPAKRVIVRARKDSKSGVTLHPGIVLHQENGAYTEDAERILRGMAAI